MAKTHTFKELFQNWQKAKAHLEEVRTQLQGLKKGEHAYNYQVKYVKEAEKTEKFWLEKMGNYGKGAIIQATGVIKWPGPNEGYWTDEEFYIYLVNAEIDEVRQYLLARFPNIKKETIQLTTFQTGILNV